MPLQLAESSSRGLSFPLPDPTWEAELETDRPEALIAGPIAGIRQSLDDLGPAVEMWFRRQHKPYPRFALRFHLYSTGPEISGPPGLCERLGSVFLEHGLPPAIPAAAPRSAAVFGGEPFLSHDGYVARFVHYLARTSDAVIELFTASPDGAANRQNLLFQALADGLTVSGLDAGAGARRVAYLRFHRDWLVRFPLLERGGDPATGRQVVERFEQRASAMAPALEQLRTLLETSAEDKDGEESVLGAWRVSLGELASEIRRLAREPRFDVDPFASDPVFLPLFKAHHNLANQLGFDLLQEAFTHHLLLRAVAPAAAAEPVALTWEAV